MRIAISGASGTIGRRLLQGLATDGATLHALGRRAAPGLPAGARPFAWDPPREEPPAAALDVDAVIHLAGENVAQRWTAEARRRILESRVEGTRNLVRAMGRLPRKPAVLICASATGYYGSRGDETLDESSAPGSGFLADVCRAWEGEARAAEALGIRVVRMRTGMVLDPDGGALPRMLTPFRLGAGGRLGSGRQWMAWIHRDDLTALFRFALDGPLAGAVNAVAPDPATNAHFTQALARTLGRPALIPVPAFALRALFGEMAGVLLDSQRVVPRQAEAAGFRFGFPQLESALSELLG